MCRCLLLSAGPGNAPDKKSNQAGQKVNAVGNLCHHGADEQDEQPMNIHTSIHSFILYRRMPLVSDTSQLAGSGGLHAPRAD